MSSSNWVTMQKTRFVWRKFEEVLNSSARLALADLTWAPGQNLREGLQLLLNQQASDLKYKFSIPGSRVDFRKTIFWILDDFGWSLSKKKNASYHGARYINYPPNQVFQGVVHFLGLFFPLVKAATFSGRLQPTMDLKQRASYKCPTEISENIEQRKQNPHMMKGPWNPQLVHWFIRILLSWLLKSSLYNLYKRQGSIVPCVQQMSRLQLSNEWARCAVPKASLT